MSTFRANEPFFGFCQSLAGAEDVHCAREFFAVGKQNGVEIHPIRTLKSIPWRSIAVVFVLVDLVPPTVKNTDQHPLRVLLPWLQATNDEAIVVFVAVLTKQKRSEWRYLQEQINAKWRANILLFLKNKKKFQKYKAIRLPLLIPSH